MAAFLPPDYIVRHTILPRILSVAHLNFVYFVHFRFPEMSLFPGYAAEGQKPSTSKEIKKEDTDNDGGQYSSFKIAKAAKEKEQRRQRDKMLAEMEEKKDKAASRRFNLGDSSDDDDCTMIVDRSESEDENTTRIIRAQNSQRKKEDQLDERKRKNRERRVNQGYVSVPIRDKIKSERRSSSPDYDRRHSSRDRKRKREKRSSSSDSDSSHRRDRKKKKEKDRDRYLEPSKSKDSHKSKKWDFMATVGVKLQNPDSYMIDERNPDGLLSNMDKTMDKECCEFGQRFTTVLGATYDVNKLFFPAKTAIRSSRLLDKAVIFDEQPENKFVRFEFQTGSTIDLSTVRCDKQIELSEEPTDEILSTREKEANKNKMIAMESDPIRRKEYREKELAEAEKKRTEANALLRKEGKNEALWIHLLELEDQVNRLTNQNNSTVANERRESILKIALSNLPKSAPLLIEKMKLKKKMNSPLEELTKEWKDIMHRMPNSLKLWDYRLNEMKHDSKQFTRNNYMEVLNQATNDLRGLLTGTMRSHSPEPGTMEYLIDLLSLRVRMEMAMGFVERGITIAQGLIESNKFIPPPNAHEYETLSEVWSKNLPLLGEPNGKGWYMYTRGHAITPSEEWKMEMREYSEKLYQAEVMELGRAALRGDHQMAIFARHERIDEKYNWRPIRAEVGESTEESLERQVEFREVITDFFPPNLHFNLVIKMIKEIGGLFYGNMMSSIRFVDPMGPRLLSFGLFNPSLHSVPFGLPEYIDRMLVELSPNDRQRGWMCYIPMSTARIRSRAWFIAQRGNSFDISAVLKELAEIATNSVETWMLSNRDERGHMPALLYIMSVYEALNLFEVHIEGMSQKMIDKSVKTIVKSIISKALIWSGRKRLDQIDDDLNRTIVLILATLLIRIPGSWDDRRLRVECVLLGKDAKTESIPTNEQIECHPMVTRLRERGVLFPNTEPHSSLHRFFGADYFLAAIIETLFLHANAAKSSSRVSSVFKDIFQQVFDHSVAYPHHYEQFYMYYIYILKHGLHQNKFRDLHLKALEHTTCPRYNTFITREYINSQQNVMKEASMLIELKRRVEEQSSPIDEFHSLARLYANRKQFTRIVASAETHSDLVIANRVAKVYIDEAKRTRDPLLWRYTLNLAAEFKNRKLGEEVFAQAFADCSWSRDLHLDYIEAFPDDDDRQQLPMIEKDIRMRGTTSLVNTFIDLAKMNGIS